MTLIEEYKQLKELVAKTNEDIQNIDENEKDVQLENFVANINGISKVKYAIKPEVQKQLEALTLDILNGIQQIIIRYDMFLANILIDSKIKVDLLMPFAIGLAIDYDKFVIRINPLYALNKNSIKEFTSVLLKELVKIIYAMHVFISEHSQNSEKDNAEISTEIFAYDTLIKDYVFRFSEVQKNSNYCGNSGNWASYREQTKSFIKIPKDAWTSAGLGNLIGKRVEFLATNLYYYNILQSLNKEFDPESMPMTLESNKTKPDEKSIDVSSPFGSSPLQNNEKYENLDGTGGANKYENLSKDYVDRAFENLDDKSRGEVPEGIIERIKKIHQKPELNWKQELKNLIGTVPVPYKSTKMKLNRRQPWRTDLPGRTYQKLVDIVFAIDTSGSVSESDLSKFLSELTEILKVYKTNITVIECDAEIGKVYKVKKPSEINYNITGRGGTSFTPVIQYVNKHKEFRNSLLLYFTDGYGENTIPKPMVYKVMWLIYNGELSLKRPYGVVKKINYRSVKY